MNKQMSIMARALSRYFRPIALFLPFALFLPIALGLLVAGGRGARGQVGHGGQVGQGGQVRAGQLAPARKSELTNLIRQDCGSCHGMTLKGGLGKPLLPRDLKDKSLGAIAQIILDGVPGTPMPPWRGLLKQGEALWIAGQLKSGTIKKGNLP